MDIIMDTPYAPEEAAVKISIVVPVYNDAEYLPTCLDSLINQTLKEIEILLVNDCSTDDSLQVMEEYAARDSRIRVISLPENQGQLQTQNEGIRHASGEYIMFADADDYLALNACERVWALEQESPVDILHFGANCIQCEEQPTSAWKDQAQAGFLYGRDIMTAFQEERIKSPLWSKAFSAGLLRNALSKCGNPMLRKAQDIFNTWITCYLAQSYRGCPSEILYNYRDRLGVDGSTKQIDLDMFEQYCTMEWTCSAIASFDREHANGEYEEFVQAMRLRQLRRCVALWRDMALCDQPEALRLLLRYWSKPGDLGKIVGAFSRVFGARQGEFAELIVSALRDLKIPTPKKPFRTVGTFYRRYFNGGIEFGLSKTLPVYVRLGYRVVFLTDEENIKDNVLPKGVIRVNCAVSQYDGADDYAERGENWENLLKKYEIDVIVYHNCYGNSQLWDTLLCRLMGIPVLTFYHATFDWILGMSSAATLIPGAGRLSDGVIVLNEMDRTFWRCVVPGTKVFQVKNPLKFALDTTEPSDSADPFAILWAARLDSKQKRYLDAVEIMAEVVKRVPDAKLYLVGSVEGDRAINALNSKITELGVEESVIPCGFQMDVAPYYQKASVFLLTSIEESFCNSLAEALTFGLPVVMYEIPYLTLVKGNAGIVSVPQLDIRAAADAICELLENQEYRRDVGRRGREFIEDLYARDEITEQWRRIFDSIGEPDSEAEESEACRMAMTTLLNQYKASLPVPLGKNVSDVNRFLYGDVTKQLYAELRSGGPQDKRTVAFVTQQEKKFNVLLNSDGNRNWVTPDELKKAVQASSDADLFRFLYGDAAKQQYAVLRANGPRDKLAVSLVTQQDGKKRFNVLLNSDGTRNWVTPKELTTLTKRSDASEMELEAKVEELTEQLKQLQARYADLSERRKVRPRRVKVKIYRWKKK